MSTVERHRKRWNHEYTGAGKYCPPHCVEWQGGCRVPPEYCQDWRAWKNYADDLGELCENLSEEIERLTATVDILTRSLNSHVGSASAKKCPVCNGSGGWYDYSRASTAVHGNYQNCHGCGGKGWVTT